MFHFCEPTVDVPPEFSTFVLKAASRFGWAVLFSFLFAVSAVSAQVAPPDSQFWADLNLDVNLSKKLSLSAVAIIREGRDISIPVNEEFALGLNIRVNKSLTLTPMYRFFSVKVGGRAERQRRHIFNLDATWRWNLPGKFVLIDRNRGDFGTSGGRFVAAYRNRIRLERPFKFGEKGKRTIIPYVMEEIFFDLREHSYTRSEFRVGFRMPLFKHFEAGPYYLRQDNTVGRASNVVALQTRISF